MPKIRILVVDDSVVVRRLVTDSLQSDPELTVVAAAANGKIALNRLEQANPDVIVLDVEMPEMDGLETLSALRKTHPKLPVIMFSTLTERGAAATLEALARGASDYVTKPANVGGVNVAVQRIRDELVPKIKALCGRGAPVVPIPPRPQPAGVARVGEAACPARPSPAASLEHPARVDVVAIGVSTGGPVALERLFADLPADLPVPVVVVQHMPPLFTDMLAKRLDAKCPLQVAEGVEGAALVPGRAWIAPGDHHLTAVRGSRGVHLHVSREPPENSCRPAVDVLFRSVADAYGSNVLATVLTGMGQDGLRGAERIVEGGGTVLAQDQATSVVWGMPGFVAGAGLAEKVLPIDRLGAEIVERVRRGRHGSLAACREVADGAAPHSAGGGAGRLAASTAQVDAGSGVGSMRAGGRE